MWSVVIDTHLRFRIKRSRIYTYETFFSIIKIVLHKLPVILNFQHYLCSYNVFSSKFITQILVINTSNPYIPSSRCTKWNNNPQNNKKHNTKGKQKLGDVFEKLHDHNSNVFFLPFFLCFVKVCHFLCKRQHFFHIITW